MGSRAQAQQLWRMGSAVLQHVGSSWTRARTRDPCIGRRILNHCTTREALDELLKSTYPARDKSQYIKAMKEVNILESPVGFKINYNFALLSYFSFITLIKFANLILLPENKGYLS